MAGERASCEACPLPPYQPGDPIPVQVYKGVFTGRHIGYTRTGFPIIEPLPEVLCKTTLPRFFRCQQFSHKTYRPIPIVGYALTCCDAISDLPKVEYNCFAGGISQRLVAYVDNCKNCPSAESTWCFLDYQTGAGTGSYGGREFGGTAGLCDSYDPCLGDGCDEACCGGYWEGSLSLRGGTLNLRLCCNGSSWRLYWYGCECGCLDCNIGCTDPLRYAFLIPINNCCDCYPNITDDEDYGLMSVYIVGNCHETVFGRHIDYNAQGIPIIEISRDCQWHTWRTTCTPTCTLFATMQSVGTGCDCINDVDWPGTEFVTGVIPLYWDGTDYQWQADLSGKSSCGTIDDYMALTVYCNAILDSNGRPSGRIRITCAIGGEFVVMSPYPLGGPIGPGSVGTGSDTGCGIDTVEMDEEDLEWIDHTFYITVPERTGCLCAGVIAVRVTR